MRALNTTLVFLIMSLLIGSAISQERRPLSIVDIETLLRGKVGQQRVIDLINERGVNFELSQSARSRLGNVGANASLLEVVEKASAKYVQQQSAEEQSKKAADARQRAEEEQRRQEALKQQESEARRRQIEQEKAKKTEQAATSKIDPTNPIASAPPCPNGARLDLRYQNDSRFSLQFNKQEDGLCAVGSSRYDDKWALVKVVDSSGKEVNSPSILFPLIGRTWLSFPLSIGKQWTSTYSANFKRGSRGSATSGSFTDAYSVLAYEGITVPAGTFMAFKIRLRQEVNRLFVESTGQRRHEFVYGVRYFWYSPEIGYFVKQSSPVAEASSSYFWSNDSAIWGDDDFDLVSLTRSK